MVCVRAWVLQLTDFLGGFNYLGATLEKAGILPDASLSQVR